MVMSVDPEERAPAKAKKKKDEEASMQSAPPVSPAPPTQSIPGVAGTLESGVKAAFMSNGKLGPRDAMGMSRTGRGVKDAFSKRRR